MEPVTESELNGDIVRDEMKDFWLGHSEVTDVTKMLLDSGAAEISKEELPEVLSLIPDIRGKKVLELAGGIGRFTGVIAQQASHVTTVDFMERFIEESKKNNKTFTNIDYVVDDVMNLEFENESFDLIFSNWLLIYFCEEDLHKLVSKLLMWLKDGGFFFFRESCGGPSGDIKDRYNPSLYRLPDIYNNVFGNASLKDNDKGLYGFSLRFTRNLQSYIKFKGNRDQICWLMQKTRINENNNIQIRCSDYKEFMRNKENSKRNIVRYEKIFGEGFISIGGLQILQEFTSTLQQRPGQKVLNVGCGVGGAEFYMAKEYGADVLGVDVSSIHIEIAWEKKYKNFRDAHVCFEIGDIGERNYPGDFFDLIISRDAIRQVNDKESYMKRFFNWLKAGGKIVFSVVCVGADSMRGDGSEMYSTKAYREMIEAAGFVDIKPDDRSKQMVTVINNAKVKVTENIQEYTKDFTKDELTTLATTWDNEIKRYETGDQIWCVFTARKPTDQVNVKS